MIFYVEYYRRILIRQHLTAGTLYGNNTKLKKKLSVLVKKKKELTAILPEKEKELFTNYVLAYNELSSIGKPDSSYQVFSSEQDLHMILSQTDSLAYFFHYKE